MKNKKTVSALLLLFMLLSIVNVDLTNAQTRGTPPEIELPDGWDDMTEEEQREYMEENKPEGMERGQGGGQRGENGEEKGTPPDMELPDGWEDMTAEEQRAYIEANRPEDAEGGQGNRQTQNQATTKATNNYTQNARKAQRYKNFTGTLQAKKTFTDENGINNKTAVYFLQQRGIISGYSDGSFGAQNAINRAETLKVLLEALSEEIDDTTSSHFSDVPSGAWFTGYVNKAKELGIVDGYTDGTFKPGKTVTQAELLKIAFESFGIDLSDYPVSNMPTGISADAWYAKYLRYALDNNLLDEPDLNLSEGMNRESFSELVYRLIQQQESL